MTRYVTDTRRIRDNVALLRKTVDGVPVIGVVKCNGYGAGLVPAAQILVEEGIAMLAVMQPEEAATLRAADIRVPVLMLTPAVTAEEARAVTAYQLTACVDCPQTAALLEREALRAGVCVPVHIMLDTGFGRFGFLPGQEETILRMHTACPHLRITGCFSHLHDSFMQSDRGVRRQTACFLAMTGRLAAAGLDVGMRHIAGTAAALRYPYARLDAVRVGSAFYGLLPMEDVWGFQPVGHLESTVAAVKWLPKGHNIGYGDMYRTRRPTRIAVIPAGHFDGWGMAGVRDSFRLRDHLRYIKEDFRRIGRDNRLFVEIGGRPAPLLGRLTLSNAIADVTDIPCRTGDTVTICTPPTGISPGVTRVYI